MQVIRITKYFRFETAHVLKNYDGPCKNIHGHSYKLAVTIRGIPLLETGHPKSGMVMDFNDINKLVKSLIIDEFDHSLILNANDFKGSEDSVRQITAKINWVSYQPTCENLLADFANRLRSNIPSGIELFCLKLNETETSYAEWYASDNQ